MMLEPVSIVAEPAVFPRVEREDLELANLLATRGLTLPLEVDGSRHTLLLAPARPLAEPRSVLACRLDTHAVLLSIEENRLQGFLPELAAGTTLGALPDALAMAAAEVAFRPLLDALGPLLGAGLSLVAPHGPVPPGWPAVTLCPADDSAAAPLAVLHLGPEAAAAVTRRLRELPAAPTWEAAAITRVPLAAQLCGTRLTLAELGAVAAGDVILLPAAATPDTVEIVAGNRARRIGAGRRAESTITIDSLSEGAMAEAEENAGEKQPPPPEDGSTVAVDDIEVSIGFSLGQRLVSVAELRTLAPGYTFELEPQDRGAVGIVANGREVGRGELIQIDDRLGVRVLRLAEPRDG